MVRNRHSYLVLIVVRQHYVLLPNPVEPFNISEYCQQTVLSLSILARMVPFGICTIECTMRYLHSSLQISYKRAFRTP